jgi:subtilisin family serine protease
MRRRGLLALVLGVAAALTVPSGAQAAPPPAPRTSGSAFTLITGDRVVITAGGGAAVQPGPGRGAIHFLGQTIKGHRYVIPSDAVPLLRAQRLDRRLFDLTALAAFGYDDRSAELPLLVAYPKAGNRKPAMTATAVRGARVTRDLPVAGALAVRADRAARADLWSSLTSGTPSGRTLRPGVERIWLDGKRKISLDHSVPQIGAPEAWQAGLDGTGVTVAILDTGVDATHPDLAGRIAGAENFTATPSTDDTVGHGTHVASIIAGSGAASGGRYRGVAPGAKLLIGKVCGDEFCEDSDILAGMTWAASRAPVINMSLGGGDTPDIDPLEQAVGDLTAQYGTLFVIAAGNDGGFAPVSSPSTADAALAVGAVDRDDQLAYFSSRGPRTGDGAIKPDITAPGVEIVAAKAKNGVIGDPAPVDGYTTLSGTSMATPHVSGAAAILAQQHPDWSAGQRKTVLMGAAKPTAGVDVFGQGAGRVDVARAIKQAVATDEGSVSFGRQRWPHGDDVPVAKTVTYRNDGTAPVTLALALDAAAPAGTFSLAASSLTVPAGGTAATTITVDTRVDGPDGRLSGYLTATAAGGVRVETPVAVDKEVESYDVTVTHTNRDGTPNDADHLTVLTNLDTLEAYFADGATSTVRLPKGSYGMFSWLYTGVATEDRADDTTTMLVQPELVVTGPAGVQLDARTAKPLSVTVPAADASPALIVATAEWVGESYSNSASLLSDTFAGQFLGQLGPKTPVAGFTGSVNASFARLGDGSPFRNSPYTYDLAWPKKGSFFTGFSKVVRARDLATIKTTFATEATGAQGAKFNAGVLDENSGFWAVLLPFDLPFQRTEYVNTDGGATWLSEFDQELPPVGDGFPDLLSYTFSEPATFQAGRTYRQEWNRAAFGPAVAKNTAVRAGDLIFAGVPLFGEGSGHPGVSTVDSARVALYSGNTLIGENADQYGEFEVPSAAAGYRLEASATRGVPHTLSSTVSAVWTFRSGHVTGEQPAPLSLSTVRISPRLDDRNAAPAGRRFDIPLTVEHQATGRARVVTAEVSYDDGQTWQRATVRGGGDHRVVTVRHPRSAGFVSLRVHAAGAAGNSVTQTVIRAYALR